MRPFLLLMRHCIVAIGSALVLLALPVELASAQPTPRLSYDLRWTTTSAPEACPSARPRLVAAVTERLGFDPFAAPTPGRHIDAAYAHERAGHELTLTFTDEAGAVRSTRRLESGAAECRVILEAASLAIAVAIREELQAAEERASTEPRPDPSGDAGAAAPCPDVKVPRRPPRPSPPPAPLDASGGARVGVAAAVIAGALPKLAVGVDVSGRAAITPWIWGSVGLVHAPEVSAADARFKVGLDLGRVGLCADPWQKRTFDLATCVHANLGAYHTIVQGLLSRAPEPSFVSGASLGQWVAYRPTPQLAIFVGEELAVPYPRYKLIVGGSNRSVFTATAVEAFTFVGIALTGAITQPASPATSP